MDPNHNPQNSANQNFLPMEGTVEAAAMVVAGMEHGHYHHPPNNNNLMIAPAPPAAPAAPVVDRNLLQGNEDYPTFCSDDPAAAALAVSRGAAMVGRMAAEMSGEYVKRKRLCRYPGCTKVIKSQGHCQRHGAKAKRCKVDGCNKQAQGTHEGTVLVFTWICHVNVFKHRFLGDSC
jgi:hypothetical protein